MKRPSLKQVAKESAIRLLAIGVLKKNWTPAEQSAWTRAFNALEKLSGRKIG